MRSKQGLVVAAAASIAIAAAAPIGAQAQEGQEDPFRLDEAGYFEAPAVNVLVFSNWYDGLFADAKQGLADLVAA